MLRELNTKLHYLFFSFKNGQKVLTVPEESLWLSKDLIWMIFYTLIKAITATMLKALNKILEN